jgi:alpha-galactosidase
MDHDTTQCFAELSGDVLRIGNAQIERRWLVHDGRLLPTSLRVAGREWLAGRPQPGSVPPQASADHGAPRIELRHGRASPVEAASLCADLSCGPDLAWTFQVFPGIAAVSCRLLRWPSGTVATAVAQTAAISGIEGDHATAAHDDANDLCERLVLSCHHAHVHGVTLADRTDGHDNLATPFELRITPCEQLRLPGCVFAVEDPLSGDGLLLLKQAPLPHARPVPNPVDLRAWFDGGHPAVALHGHGVRDGGAGYAWSLAGYRGGTTGRIATLHRLQRCFRTFEAGRDGQLLSNTWGDRNRDGRICADFMAREIAAGAALGVDVVQIDDGWQRGTTSNSVNREQGGVWQGFWAADDRFWDANPQRFPAGLAGTAALARERGLAFGLWFAPDSIDDFRNWRRDADTVLGFWRTHGVTRVKIDGVKAHSKPGELNLQRFFAAVLGESAGSITFDLDVTAEVRPGYLGAIQAGPLFVENRYTDWHRWWPHATLRNLWQLAHWIDPVRLRMEFLNRHRHAVQYAGDPLAPMAYPADWLFASIMVASPLAWFEVSELPAEDTACLAPLIALWKRHRAELHGGTILPVGACPSGAGCSGFCSVAEDGRSALLVALREPAAGSEARWALPLAAGAWAADLLAGSGSATMDGTAVTLRFDATPSYLMLRLSQST